MAEPTCPVCAQVVERTKPTGPMPKYCSNACRSKAAYVRGGRERAAIRRAKARAKRPAPIPRPCKTCGGDMVGRPDKVYCSKKCAARPAVKRHRQRHGRRRQDEYFDRSCVQCEMSFRSSRKTGKFCSDECKGKHYSTAMSTRCKLPAEHPVMVLIAKAVDERRELAAERRRERDRIRARSDFEWRTARECPGCACHFTPLFTSTMLMCSPRCSRRVNRRRRRAREVNAMGSWVWSDFMRIARKFNYCCAYCGIKAELEPDHVVPLSRGGYDSPSNLLPSCHLCNSDKCARTLDEWAAWREAKGKPPRMTNWAPEDKRFTHLTQVLEAIAA